MTSFFSAEGCPIWIKFRRLVQNGMSTAVIWSKSQPDVEFQYGGRLGEFNDMSSQSHIATWRIQCHDPRATCQCHIAGCCNRGNLMACLLRATYRVAGCCHLLNSLSCSQSHMPHCRVQSPGEISVMIVQIAGCKNSIRILTIVLRYDIKADG